MRNVDISETQILDDVLAMLRERWPDSWTMDERRHLSQENGRVDVEIQIRAGRSRPATVLGEVMPSAAPRQLSDMVGRLRGLGPADGYLLIAPFLSRQARSRLRDAGVSYADATGNVRIAIDRPAVFVELEGADKDPSRERRPVKSLKGPAAAAVVRALIDFRPPYGIRELAERADLAASSNSRIVTFLDQEALVDRRPGGGIESVDWPGVLRRWTEDYGVIDSNRTRLVLEPRGVNALVDKSRGDPGVVITGSLAASLVAPVASPALATVYVRDLGSAQRRLDLREVPTGANVMLVEPFSEVALERAWERDGVQYAALPQVAADLLTSPGRGPSEGEALIEWMGDHEGDWRRT